MQQRALILFAHGARDAAWARPVNAVAQSLQQRMPELPICVAFLEFMHPSLEEAIATLVATYPSRQLKVDILPFFIAQGGHLRDDVPRLLENAAKRHNGISLRLLPALGELPAVQSAMALAISQLLAEESIAQE